MHSSYISSFLLEIPLRTTWQIEFDRDYNLPSCHRFMIIGGAEALGFRVGFTLLQLISSLLPTNKQTFNDSKWRLS